MKTRAFIYFFSLAALLVFAAAGPATAQNAPPAENLTPETLTEKVSMAEFVVVGEVRSAAPLPGQGTSVSKPLIEEMTAEVEVKRVLKGALGDGRITVEFKRSDRPSKPPRPSLVAGETAVLFLRRGSAAGTLRFITPFAGKERAGVGVEEKVAALVESLGQTSSVEARLTLSGEAFAPGAPVRYSAIIANVGKTPVTLYTYMFPARDFVVTREDGSPVAPASAASAPAPIRDHFTTLQPGQFIGLSGDLAADFPLAEGTYSAALVLKCPSGDTVGAVAWSGAVISPRAGFKVTE